MDCFLVSLRNQCVKLQGKVLEAHSSEYPLIIKQNAFVNSQKMPYFFSYCLTHSKNIKIL